MAYIATIKGGGGRCKSRRGDNKARQDQGYCIKRRDRKRPGVWLEGDGDDSS